MLYTLIVFHCTCVKISKKLLQIFISHLNVLQPTTLKIHVIRIVHSSFMPNFKMFRAGLQMRSTTFKGAISNLNMFVLIVWIAYYLVSTDNMQDGLIYFLIIIVGMWDTCMHCAVKYGSNYRQGCMCIIECNNLWDILYILIFMITIITCTTCTEICDQTKPYYRPICTYS